MDCGSQGRRLRGNGPLSGLLKGPKCGRLMVEGCGYGGGEANPCRGDPMCEAEKAKSTCLIGVAGGPGNKLTRLGSWSRLPDVRTSDLSQWP